MQEVGPVDVEHIERDRNLGDALCLGYQLLGQDRGRHDVEHMDGVEDDRTAAPKTAGGQMSLGTSQIEVVGSVVERGQKLVSIGKAPVKRGARNAGSGGDVTQPH